MKNISKFKKLPLLGIIVFLMIIGILLSSCMSMLFGIAKKQYADYGVYDKSVADDQSCELRFGLVIIKSFNGAPVSWGNKPDTNMGHVKIPAGVNTIVFDWVSQTTQLTDTQRSGNTIKYTYTVTTKSLKNITFSNVNMTAGHTYFVGGGKGNDGDFRFWLLDQTNMPSGFYGDTVPKPPKASKAPTEFEGKWKNSFGETFVFSGNTWLQTLPPYTGTNTGPNQIQLKGTFSFENGTMTLHYNETSVDGGMWVNLKPMENAYIYKYFFNGNILLLELPYMLPVTEYIRQ